MITIYRLFTKTEILDFMPHLYTMVLNGLLPRMKILYSGSIDGILTPEVPVRISLKKLPVKIISLQGFILKNGQILMLPAMIIFPEAVQIGWNFDLLKF